MDSWGYPNLSSPMKKISLILEKNTKITAKNAQKSPYPPDFQSLTKYHAKYHKQNLVLLIHILYICNHNISR